jgi:hypothetical protein
VIEVNIEKGRIGLKRKFEPLPPKPLEAPKAETPVETPKSE